MSYPVAVQGRIDANFDASEPREDIAEQGNSNCIAKDVEVSQTGFQSHLRLFVPRGSVMSATNGF